MGAACSGESATQTKGNSHQPAAARKDESAAHYFETIRDKFETVEEVQSELRKAGLESSELIVAIDLTKSNEWSGNKSFNGVHPAMHCRGMLSLKSTECAFTAHDFRTHMRVGQLVPVLHTVWLRECGRMRSGRHSMCRAMPPFSSIWHEPIQVSDQHHCQDTERLRR